MEAWALALLTGSGFAAAAGLNAFIPIVLVGALAKFTDVIVLPTQLEWLESWWTLAIGLVLLLSELVLDKIPGVDHINDLLQSLVRPIVGGVMFIATASAEVQGQTDYWIQHPWIAGISGALIALGVHTGKAVSRPAVNASTGGTGAPLASFAEDAIAIGLCLVALFIPILVILVFVFLGIALYRIVTTGRRRRRRRAQLEAMERAEREAQVEAGAATSWWRGRWR
mgnify:CR=1 FL=1